MMLVAGSAAVAIVANGGPKPGGPKPTASPSPTLTPTPSPTPTPGPLTIAAIRAHPLTPGAITVTQTLSSRGGCKTQVVRFGSDGLTEYALLTTPATAKPASGFPVIILAHGYIAPTSYQTTGTDYQGFINSFCAAGYLVLKLDYRGNGNSGGAPTTGDLDPGYTYDLLNLTASLPSLPGTDANRVAWLGHSMGGAVVLRAAVASHNLPVKAIILASGVVGSLDDIFYNWPTSELPADLVPIKTQTIATYGAPPAHPEFWHDASAINYVSGITAPVEINHGTADTVVPVAFSQALDSALTAADKPHVFHTYVGGDHQYSVTSARNAFISNSLAFLAANL